MTIWDAGSLTDRSRFTEKVSPILNPVLAQFEKIISVPLKFKMLFIGLLTLEVLGLVIFIPFFLQSALFAIALAAVLMTIFTYFLIREYYNTQKEDNLQRLKEKYLNGCKTVFHEDDHGSLAKGCYSLANILHTYHQPAIPLPDLLQKNFPALQKYSENLYWKDIHLMKEILLKTAIEELIKLIKSDPTSLEYHTSLANAYVMLSGLYVHKNEAPKSFHKTMEQKFRKASERAIEEFKIIQEYAPNDPWVHNQLAFSYRDLHMPKEEMKEYETLLKLNPEDAEAHLNLGILYFAHGENAKGLKIYQSLQHLDLTKAETLISHYGAYAEDLAHTKE